MATFSLLNVYATNPDGTVDGYWIQDHIGTFETARTRARETEAANSNRIQVVVVDRIVHPTPRLEVWTRQRPAR